MAVAPLSSSNASASEFLSFAEAFSLWKGRVAKQSVPILPVLVNSRRRREAAKEEALQAACQPSNTCSNEASGTLACNDASDCSDEASSTLACNDASDCSDEASSTLACNDASSSSDGSSTICYQNNVLQAMPLSSFSSNLCDSEPACSDDSSSNKASEACSVASSIGSNCISISISSSSESATPVNLVEAANLAPATESEPVLVQKTVKRRAVPAVDARQLPSRIPKPGSRGAGVKAVGVVEKTLKTPAAVPFRQASLPSGRGAGVKAGGLVEKASSKAAAVPARRQSTVSSRARKQGKEQGVTKTAAIRPPWRP